MSVTPEQPGVGRLHASSVASVHEGATVTARGGGRCETRCVGTRAAEQARAGAGIFGIFRAAAVVVVATRFARGREIQTLAGKHIRVGVVAVVAAGNERLRRVAVLVDVDERIRTRARGIVASGLVTRI